MENEGDEVREKGGTNLLGFIELDMELTLEGKPFKGLKESDEI